MKRRGSPYPVLLILSLAGTVASAVLVCLLVIEPATNAAVGIWPGRILPVGAAIAFLAFFFSFVSLLLHSCLRNSLPVLAEFAQRYAGADRGMGGKRGKALEKAAEFADSNPNLILTVTEDGRIIYANRSVEKMLFKLGLPAQHYELLLPDHTEEIVREVLLGKEKDRRVVRKIMERTIEYTVIRLEEGEAVGFYGTEVAGKGVEREKAEKLLRRA